jgi:hypothetical protein
MQSKPERIAWSPMRGRNTYISAGMKCSTHEHADTLYAYVGNCTEVLYWVIRVPSIFGRVYVHVTLKARNSGIS